MIFELSCCKDFAATLLPKLKAAVTTALANYEARNGIRFKPIGDLAVTTNPSASRSILAQILPPVSRNKVSASRLVNSAKL